MNIIIIPPDNLVAVDGVWKTVPIVSAGLGHADIEHINAARLEGDRGSIEHRERDGYWPSPRTLNADDFKAEFADILAAYAEAKAPEETVTDAQEPSSQATSQAPTVDDYLALIERGAEVARLSKITGGVGMALTYVEKKDQAIAVLALPLEADVDPADFPLLAASVDIEAATLREAAELVMQRYEAFVEIVGAIERVRLSTKKAIREAGDVVAARAIYEAVQWP